MNVKLLFSMSHEPTLNCLLKLESTIVNINLAIKSFSFLVISLIYLLDYTGLIHVHIIVCVICG